MAILVGLFGIGRSRVFGSAVDDRGLLWRKPPGHASRSPLKQGLPSSRTFARHHDLERFAAVCRAFAALFEAASILLIAGGVAERIAWTLGRVRPNAP